MKKIRTAVETSEVQVRVQPPKDIDATWTYAQQTGELQQDGKPVSTGYSGATEGKNNPAMENVPNIGPIPRGDWTIAGPPVDSKDHGPYVLKLNPATYDRNPRPQRIPDARRLQRASRSASHGCVILSRAVREEVWQSGDRDLEVVAEIPCAESSKDLNRSCQSHPARVRA